ncbi:MAG: elongation factor P [Candidatus Scalinduaceae bacterium]
MVNATDIRKGLIIKIDGELFSVSDFQHVTPGKGRAHMQVSIKSLKQGNVTQKRFRSTDKVEDVFLEHKEMEYLYKDREDFCFMNTENYEQVLLTKEVLGDTMLYITPNSKIKVSFYEGNAIGIELPASVTLKIIETDPGTKGDTVTNVFKPAKLETGHIIKVPLFINPGELVKVDTRTGQFMGRA